MMVLCGVVHLPVLTHNTFLYLQALAGRFMLGDQEVVLDVAPDDPLPLKVEALRQYLETTLGSSKFRRYGFRAKPHFQKQFGPNLILHVYCTVHTAT